MESWYAHSKFKLAMLAFLASLALFCTDKLTAGQWSDFNVWLIGLYFGANVAATAVTKKADA